MICMSAFALRWVPRGINHWMKSSRNENPLSDLITPFPSSCFLQTLITCLVPHTLLHLHLPFPFSFTPSLFKHSVSINSPLSDRLSALFSPAPTLRDVRKTQPLLHKYCFLNWWDFPLFLHLLCVLFAIFFSLLEQSEAPILTSLQCLFHFMSSSIFLYLINIRTEIHLKTKSAQSVMLL